MYVKMSTPEHQGSEAGMVHQTAEVHQATGLHQGRKVHQAAEVHQARGVHQATEVRQRPAKPQRKEPNAPIDFDAGKLCTIVLGCIFAIWTSKND